MNLIFAIAIGVFLTLCAGAPQPGVSTPPVDDVGQSHPQNPQAEPHNGGQSRDANSDSHLHEGQISVIEIIELCQENILAAERALAVRPKDSKELEEKLEIIKESMNEIIDDKVAHITFDAYELSALTKFLTDLQEHDLKMLHSTIQAKLAEATESHKGEELEGTESSAITIYIERCRVKLMAIEHEVSEHQELLATDGVKVIHEAMRTLDDVKRLFGNRDDLAKASQAVDELQKALANVHFKPTVEGDGSGEKVDHDKALQSHQGHNKHTHNHAHVGHKSAVEIIDLCQSAILGVENLYMLNPDLPPEIKRDFELIKKNSNVIIKNKVAHVIFDTYELDDLERFLHDLRDDKMEALKRHLATMYAPYDPENSEKKKEHELILAKKTIRLLIQEIEVKLLAIDSEVKEHKDLLVGGGFEHIENAKEEVDKLRKSFERHFIQEHKALKIVELKKALLAVEAIQVSLDDVEFEKTAHKSAIHVIELCFDAISAAQDIIIDASELPSEAMVRLRNLDTTINEITENKLDHNQITLDRYDRDTLSRFFKDLRDKEFDEIERSLSAIKVEYDEKLVAKLVTAAQTNIAKAVMRLTAILHEAKQQEDLLGEDAKASIENAFELLKAVHQSLYSDYYDEALEGVKEIKSELLKVQFKKIPRFPFEHIQLSAHQDVHSAELKGSPKGSEDHKHLHNQSHEGNISAFEIIELCLSAIEDADAVLVGVPHMPDKYRRKLELIKRNMRTIIKNKTVHAISESYELSTLEEYLSDLVEEDLAILYDLLTERLKDGIEEMEVEDIITRGSLTTLCNNNILRAHLKLLIIAHVVKKNAHKLMGDGLKVVEEAVLELDRVKGLIEKNELSKAAENANKIKSDMQTVQFEKPASGDTEPIVAFQGYEPLTEVVRHHSSSTSTAPQ